MARVKDLWLAEVPVKGADGKTVKGEDGRVLRVKRKTSKHPDNGGSRDAKRWLAVWLDPDGKEVTKAFAKTSDARAYAAKMEGDAERGEYIDKDAGKARFGELALKWLRLRDVGASSMVRYESVYRNHVEPAFARRPVKAVRPSDVAEWLRHGSASKLSDAMKETAYYILAGTFDLAVADKLRRDNPARSKIITPPEAVPLKRPLWDVPLVWRVIDEHPEPYRVIPVLEAGMGLRQGCAFGISPDDFEFAAGDTDFEAGKAVIRRQVVRVKGKFYFKLPKGNKERTVPVSRGVAAFVRAYGAKYPPVAVTLPWLNEDGTTASEPATARLLVAWHGDDPRTHGKQVGASSYHHGVWLPALSRAGLAPPPVKDERKINRYQSGGRENGQHALRHFFSAALQDGGVGPVGVMEFMGHSRKGLPVTFRVYGHVTDETFAQARDAIDRALFRLRSVDSSGTVTELRAAQ
jgi:integrase